MQSLHAGDRSSVTHSILRLGIALLEEGNDHIQGEMLDQLKSMDVGFLASVAHLISGCSVLDWNAYERHQKSEMMHSSKSLGLYPFPSVPPSHSSIININIPTYVCQIHLRIYRCWDMGLRLLHAIIPCLCLNAASCVWHYYPYIL